jgi:hypothetical protein
MGLSGMSAPPMPTRTGYAPVSSEARDAEHTGCA